MLYEFKGYNGKVELYDNKIVIVRNAFSTFPRGTKEIYIKNIAGVQIKKPGLSAGYIQFIFSGSKEVKSKNIMDSAHDENTIMFNSGYDNALILKQKIEELINKANEPQTQHTYIQSTSQADEIIKFKQLLDAGAISLEEFNIQKNRILGKQEPENSRRDENANNENRYNYLETPISKKGNSKVQKNKMDRKKAILLFAAILFLLIGVVVSSSDNSTKNDVSQNDVNAVVDTDISLDDVKEWYENQMSMVSQSLIEYAKSVDGISAINVSDSKFRFGEDSGWFDCHYTIYFTCKINGVVHSGESRAFLKYNQNDITWFHFEIFSNDDIVSIVEHYDAEYDKIIEEYYKELTSTYK